MTWLFADPDGRATFELVNAIDQDAANALTMTVEVQREIRDLAHWREPDLTPPLSAPWTPGSCRWMVIG